MAAIAAMLLGAVAATPARAATQSCPDGVVLLPNAKPVGGEAPDLVVTGTCEVEGAGEFNYGRVNIINTGRLVFIEPGAESVSDPTKKRQDFWARAIIVERGGRMLAGVQDDPPTDDPKAPKIDEPAYGTRGFTLAIHLYGKDPRKTPVDDEGPGESCVKLPENQVAGKEVADCGIPETVWGDNGKNLIDLPGHVKDYFYQYSNLHGDSGTDPATGEEGHFGYKVLAVSYGGTLRLHGLKGTTGTSDADITTMLKPTEKWDKQTGVADEKVMTDPGTDWTRLGGYGDGKELTLDMPASRTKSIDGDWKPGDEVVVTSTDYLPSHSELRTIASVKSPSSIILNDKLEFKHNDKAYDIAAKLGSEKSSFRDEITKIDGNEGFLEKAETRAAVALLTRSIQIVSGGDNDGDKFPDAPTDYNAGGYMYGGHVVFRQGFEKVQIRGVEFKQLGQGGLLGRYPIHFHVARRVPDDTYVIDSSINESMTRWIVIHSTLGVTVARNVGWKSIGHGFFLEDATETDNKFFSNIGVYARGSVIGSENPRKIPGLLDARNGPDILPLKYHSDANYPSVFWITNGWNAFVGNMAASAGTCGACYWYVPAGNHDMMEVGPNGAPMSLANPMSWTGYSLIQKSDQPNPSGSAARAGISPIQAFYRNYCSTAMHSLSNTDESPCYQIEIGQVEHVLNPRTPDATVDPNHEPMESRVFYPRYSSGRKPAYCDPSAAAGAANSCEKVTCDYKDPKDCAPSVFSHYTSSFSWAGINFSAIWLRHSYLLLDHAFLSDVQSAGVTLVTGGDYLRSNMPVGFWALLSHSIFVGETQPGNPDAQAKGPNARCDNSRGDMCIDRSTGVAYPKAGYSVAQRMYNVYDGPAYEDANAFFDIHPSPCNTPGSNASGCMYWGTLGVRRAHAAIGKDIPADTGYLPNAAIAWKQSNGFYYPPAFHSENLLFKDVDIRHYVIEPLTFPGTYRTNVLQSYKEYAGIDGNIAAFRNWSDIDRQTELSDDDGSLTGLISSLTGTFKGSISVNEDPFFAAPTQTAECRSAVGTDASNACANAPAPPNPPTARTSPYDHVTTVIYPAERGGTWASNCTNETCTGVPIYRQYLTGVKSDVPGKSTREWGIWQANDCDKQMAALRGQKRPIDVQDPYAPPAPPNPDNKPVPLLPSYPPGLLARVKQFKAFDDGCPSPFVRMAGTDLSQRSVLTVNNGKYFIDTNRSQEYQEKAPDLEAKGRNISVFKGGQTYYVFFLFAKSSTKQVYQIYGGPGFTKDMVKGVRMSILANPLAPSDWTMPWTVEPDPKTPDVLDVSVDFEKVDPKDGNLNPKYLQSTPGHVRDTCQPSQYCSVSGSGTCGCDEAKLGVLGLLDPNYVNVCKTVCGTWAVKDIDCPDNKCFGFQFTLPGAFVADDRVVRPAPEPYTPVWDKVSLKQTTTLPDDSGTGSAKDDSCHYPADKIPNDASASCKVRD